MECPKVRKQFPEIHFPPCCESCHEDEEMGYGDDLWFEIGDEDRHVCCAIMNAFVKHRREMNK